MAGILDFLAAALPRSVFANLQNSAALQRGMTDSQEGFWGSPNQVQVTPQVGTLPGEQGPAPGAMNRGIREPMYANSLPQGGLLDAVPQQQRPFIEGLAKAMGPDVAAKAAYESNVTKPMSAYETANLAQQGSRPVFAPDGETGYAKGPDGTYQPVIKGAPKPPQSRMITRGLETVTQQLNPTTNQFEDLATAPRQLPPQPQAAMSPERLTQEQQLIKDRATQQEGLIVTRQNQNLFTPEQADFFADQALAGDKSVFATVGRNQAARTQIAQALANKAKAKGLGGVDMATINAAFLGDQAAQRVIGTRTGAISVSGQEARGVANLVNDAYAKLPRDQFRPFNQLRSMYETQTSSPEQAQAYMADFSLQTAYARALNPQGIPRETDIAKAGELLNGAQSQEAHKAVVDQILKELTVIQDSTGAARVQAINRIRTERGLDPVPGAGVLAPATGGPPPPSGGPPPPPKQNDIVDGYRFLGGDPKLQRNWQKQ